MAEIQEFDQNTILQNRVRRKFLKNFDSKILTNEISEEEQKKLSVPENPLSLSNIAWLISSFLVIYYTDFVRVCLYDTDVNRTFFYIGVALYTIAVSISLFLIVWLSCIKKFTTDDWDKLYPAAIPITTVCGVMGSFSFLLALWPIWSIFTIPILFTLLMGFIVLIINIPSF